MDAQIQPGDLFIATNGNDQWSGRLPAPNATRTDGPLASIAKAKAVVFEQLRRAAFARPVTVWVRGGRYPLRHPLCFHAEESGPVTFAAYPGETPVFDGGMRISGWTETQINGRAAWVADVAALLVERGPFRSLFVNGARRARPRWPKVGYLTVERPVAGVEQPGFFEGSRQFVAAAGDLRAWRNITDVEVVALHMWIDERLPLEGYDATTRIVTSARPALAVLGSGTRYYVENVAEELGEGEWYLDRPKGRLYYLPLPGETPETAEIVVPLPLQFLRITGDGARGRFVEGLRFVGLTFQYSDWVQPSGWTRWFDPYVPPETWRARDSARHFIVNNGGDPRKEPAGVPQSAYNVPGAIHLEYARHCAIEGCTIQHIGSYGVDLREGCTSNRVVGTTLRDMAGGGVKLDGCGPQGDVARRTGRNRITDNTISGGGRVFINAMGVVCMFSGGNIIAHNSVSDLYQTGISVGWSWDYEESVARDNLIANNHVWNLGQGVLSDMGGIYTLGVSSGTLISGNHIHHIGAEAYGACGIYLDQASSNIIIENNLIHHVGEGISVHWARNSFFFNNIVALCDKQGVFLGCEPDHQWVLHPRRQILFERNIFLTNGEPAFIDYERALDEGSTRCDLNLYWDVGGREPVLYKYCPWRQDLIGAAWDYAAGDNPHVRLFDLARRKQAGYDRHSLVADPRCADPHGGDFRLRDDSPALALGFRPLDLSRVGPRPPECWADEVVTL